MCSYCLLMRSGIASAVLALTGCMSPPSSDVDGSVNLASMKDRPVDRGWDWLESRPGSEMPRR